MPNKNDNRALDRREFIKVSLAAAAVGGRLQQIADAAEKPASSAGRSMERNMRPSMTYRQLGRTNFMASRLVFGCGAALSGGKAVRLLERTFEAGINCYDTGRPYGDSESQLAPFLKAHRDEIWVTSKAAHMGWPDKRVGPDEGKEMARLYTEQLEESLREMKTDYIDAYMIMGIEDEAFVRNEELYGAFVKAKEAGKVGHYGLSTHANQQKVLEAAVETGWYDLAMVAVTPAGWYDYASRGLDEGSPTLSDLAPVLKRVRESGIGLIAMKVARMIRPQQSGIFDGFYDDKLKASTYSSCQKAYAFVLNHGLDVANSHMPNFKILEENLAVVRT